MLRSSAGFFFLFIVFLFLNSSTSTQEKLLTLDDIYDADKRVNFGAVPPARYPWLDDSHYLQGANKVNALNGEAAPFIDVKIMESAFVSLPGLSAEDAKQIAARASFRPQLSEDRKAILINYANDLFYYRI